MLVLFPLYTFFIITVVAIGQATNVAPYKYRYNNSAIKIYAEAYSGIRLMKADYGNFIGSSQGYLIFIIKRPYF